MEEEIRLIEPSLEYEQEAWAYIAEMEESKSSYAGCAMIEEYKNNYQGWLDKLKRFKTDPEQGYSKSETYFFD